MILSDLIILNRYMFNSFLIMSCRKGLVLVLIMICVFFKTEDSKAQTHDSFTISEGQLDLNFDFFQHRFLRLRTVLPESYKFPVNLPKMNEESDNEVFLHVTGENRGSHHGAKLTGGNPGMRLLFIGKSEIKTRTGKIITIVQKDSVTNLKVESFYEFYNQIPVVRRYTKITNDGNASQDIEFLSSAMLNNFDRVSPGKPQDNLKIHYAFNSWQQEGQWKTATLSELGLENNNAFNLNTISFSNLGSWSTIKYLPMGMIENPKAGLIWFWQIEHNGSWYCELSNTSCEGNYGSAYLFLGGPDAEHSQAIKILKPGESYVTVPVALGCVSGGFEEAIAALTKYRRTALVKFKAVNASCPVVFNDYMNCLWGNPLTENELPLINAAAKAGCNYFVIDAGWYTGKNESWWDGVGSWNPSRNRFAPNGLISIIDTIRSKGMVPGLWLEPEVVGIHNPLKDKPDEWFLMRNGKRIIDNSRYLLDFRNPDVRKYMSSVVERMVKEYKVGYIKMDYNNIIWGAESEGISAGQGLLEHNRALIIWYKEIADLYPELIVENCGSGGCRMDYAMLSQTQVQSCTDQGDYKKYPGILVGTLTAVLPEQLASWSYPRKDCSIKEASFNMVSAMLCRIHQSGNLSHLSTESFKMVQEGLIIYKSILAPVIPKSVPFFPLGMPSLQDSISPIALGIKNINREYIAVWRLAGSDEVFIPRSKCKSMNLLYPKGLNIKVINDNKGVRVKFADKYMAAIIEINN
jgi:alpha-galactosidase